MIVDDSAMCRQLLTDVIDAEDGLAVVGTAANGEAALLKMEELAPDLVTLDILMPEMDGIETLMAIRKKWPTVIIVMLSALTSEGSEAALDALALGASEYAVKPDSSGSIGRFSSALKIDLVPKIVALCGVEQPKSEKVFASATKKTQPAGFGQTVKKLPLRSDSDAIEIVAIGVSTGGPDALKTLLSDLPKDLGVPIVIVQHMPAMFTAKLANRLNSVSELKVVEAQCKELLQPGTVYIAPGDYHMVLEQHQADVRISLNKGALENSCRPAVDPLFRSIAEIYKSRCLGIILTGMGSDGLSGSAALSQAGSVVIAQDEVSSVVWGMPRLVVEAGLARQQLGIERMANVITQWVRKRPESANLEIHGKTRTAGGCS